MAAEATFENLVSNVTVLKTITGQFNIRPTEKNRVVIPATLREILDLNSGSQIYLGCHNRGYLELYDQDSFTALTNDLEDFSRFSQDFASWRRLFFSQLQIATLDSQGRFVLNEQMLSNLFILGKDSESKELTLIGTGDHVEIWTTDRWQIEKDKLIRDNLAISERLAFLQAKLKSDRRRKVNDQ